MTKEEILKMSDYDFRKWLVKLSKERRYRDIGIVSKVRLKGKK